MAAASRALGQLDGLLLGSGAPDAFAPFLLRVEAVASNRLVGARTTLADIFDFGSVNDPRGASREVQSASRLVGILEELLGRVVAGERQMGTLLASAEARLRTTGRLGLPGAESDPGAPGPAKSADGGRPASLPPSGRRHGPSPLGPLEKYIDGGSPEPALVTAGIAHAWLDALQPYPGDNGRIGRLLASLIIASSRTAPASPLPISALLLERRSEYLRSLRRVREGDWAGWLDFFLDAVKESSLKTFDAVRRAVALRAGHVLVLRRELERRAPLGEILLDRLCRQPVLSVPQVARATGTTFPTANALVRAFCRSGLLEESTGQRRYRLFRYAPYIGVFERAFGLVPESNAR